MRRRLLATTLAAVAAVVLLLGVPLGVAVRSLLVTQALDSLQREAEQAQVLVQQQGSVRGAALLLGAVAEETGSRLTLVDRTGPMTLQIDTGGPPDDAVFFGAVGDVEAARDGAIGRTAAPGILAVTVPVRAPGIEQVLRASRTDDALVAAVRRAWLQIGLLALVALGVAAVIAAWQARRFAAPLESLAAAARTLGEGDFTVRAPRSGLPEPDDVAAALDATADRLASLVARSRSFGADASHQLRTPLTALRLQLEALEVAVARDAVARDAVDGAGGAREAVDGAGGAREAVDGAGGAREAVDGAGGARAGAPGGAAAAALAQALDEVDRLDATIDELLALGAPETAREEVDLEALVDERLGAWRALARAQGRRVVVQAVAVPSVRVRPAAIGQSLQVLLDNALEHGRGTVTISIQPVAGGVRLCVGDEGPGLPADVAAVPGPAAGSADRAGDRGRGLPLARSLVEAEGGRLHVEHGAPHALVCLLIPTAPDVGAAPTGP